MHLALLLIVMQVHIGGHVDRIEPLPSVVVQLGCLRDGPRRKEKVLVIGELHLLLIRAVRAYFASV